MVRCIGLFVYIRSESRGERHFSSLLSPHHPVSKIKRKKREKRKERKQKEERERIKEEKVGDRFGGARDYSRLIVPPFLATRNGRTIKPNDPLFRPRIIPARASCHQELRQAETNEGSPSHPLYSRKEEIIPHALLPRLPTLGEPTLREAGATSPPSPFFSPR